MKVHNYTRHARTVLEYPDADKPVSYVNLVWSALPNYHGREAKRLGSEGPTHLTEVSSAGGPAGASGDVVRPSLLFEHATVGP